MSWIPMVREETCDGVQEVALPTRHFADRKVFLFGDITDETANEFVSELLYLAKTKEPVDVYINSQGGYIGAGLVIYDMLQACSEKMEINLYCVGMAGSMAAIIFSSGKKGHRFILPHGQVLIHEPRVGGGGMDGSASSIRKTVDGLLAVKAVTNGILAKHTGKTIEEIDKATSFDNFMGAEEAVAFGLCDEVRCPF